MVLNILLILLGFIVVLWGADRFTDGACGLARKFRVSELVIGLTVVALGTSLPEFMVSFMSVLLGSSDMSVGNIIGSNVFNILIITGMSAVLTTLAVDKYLLYRDIPLCLVASVMLVLFSLTESTITRWEGMLLVAFFLCYLYIAYRVAMKDRKASAPSAQALETDDTPCCKKKKEDTTWYLFLLILLGIAALVIGARLLVDNAASVARAWGISESVIGLTILAAGTSLPELATSLVAARKGSSALALGNVIGSNIFNIAFVIGICSSVLPMKVSEISIIDWTALVGSVVLTWLTAYTCRKLSRWEGLILVFCYIAFIMLLLSR